MRKYFRAIGGKSHLGRRSPWVLLGLADAGLVRKGRGYGREDAVLSLGGEGIRVTIARCVVAGCWS